jgi:hypothetical protein
VFEDLLQLEGIHGVVRFVTHPAFAVPQFATFVYADEAVIAAVIVRGFGLWDIVPLASSGNESQPTELAAPLERPRGTWPDIGAEEAPRRPAARDFGAVLPAAHSLSSCERSSSPTTAAKMAT